MTAERASLPSSECMHLSNQHSTAVMILLFIKQVRILYVAAAVRKIPLKIAVCRKCDEAREDAKSAKRNSAQ